MRRLLTLSLSVLLLLSSYPARIVLAEGEDPVEDSGFISNEVLDEDKTEQSDIEEMIDQFDQTDLNETNETALAFAEDTESGSEETDAVSYSQNGVQHHTVNNDTDNDQLFEGYVNQAFNPDNKSSDKTKLNANRSDRFSGANAALYSLLVEKFSATASGTNPSTHYAISVEDLQLEKNSWTVEELGVQIVVDGQINAEATAKAIELIGLDIDAVVNSLLYDMPYELYWFDKTRGYQSTGPAFSATSSELQITEGYELSFTVAEGYQGNDSYTVDPTVGTTIDTAVQNAQAIVSNNQNKTDLEKLKSFKTEICDLVSYNQSAADGNMNYGDPWQLIWVFDGDSSTNVVCEGYAKAFQYLCDSSSFEGNISSRMVSGTMSGGTGAGPHMWNVVTLNDDKNYLVDVTNCDSDSIGAPDKLFLASIDENNTTGSIDNGYVFHVNGSSISYAYDRETISIYDRSELEIAKGSYEEILPTAGNAYAVLTDDGDLIFFRSTETYENDSQQTVTINDASYTGTVYAGFEDTNTVPWNKGEDTNITSVSVASGHTIHPVSMESWFSGIYRLSSFDPAGFDTSNVTSMREMFSSCRSLASLDLSGFDTSNVSSMRDMFKRCSSLTSLDLGSFNTSNVVYMGGMFSGCSSLTSLDLGSFNTSNVTSMIDMFRDCSSLTSLGLGSFNTSNVVYMDGMFEDCSSLTSLDLGSFNTSNVTNMSGMFSGCSSLTSLDLGSFNTSNVTAMGGMFKDCSSLTSLDLGSFNTSNVTAMGNMFFGCSYLISVILGENFSFKGNGITNTSSMAILPSRSWTNGELVKTETELRDEYNSEWAGTWTRISIPLTFLELNKKTLNLKIGNSETLEVTIKPKNTTDSLSWSSSDATVATVDQNGLVTALKRGTAIITVKSDGNPVYYRSCTVTVTQEEGLAYAILTNDGDLIFFRSTETYGNGSRYAVSINNTEYTGTVYTGFEDSDTVPWDSQKGNIKSTWVAEGYIISPISTADWFSCTLLESFDPAGFDTSNVTSMREMFYCCSFLTSLDLSSFDTSSVTDMDSMFSRCSSLTSLDLGSFNTSNVTSMGVMFSGCSSLISLDLGSFNTSNVTNMSGMFSGCSSLISLDLGSFNTSNVTSMGGMFRDCSSLTSLDLGSFNTSNVVYMDGMFRDCSSLTSLDLGSFNTSNVTAMGNMFSGCSNLSSIVLGENFSFKGNGITDTSSMAILPSRSWTNGELVKTETELRDEYNSEWAGTWTKIISINSITLNKNTLAIKTGNSETLEVMIDPENATDSLVWSTSDATVATVDQNGLVTALKVGTAIITVRSNENPEVYSSCTVTVEQEDGIAYAVLTADDDLIFFRSNNSYFESDDKQTVYDIYNNEYYGYLYSDIESEWRSGFYSHDQQIKNVYVAEGQTIKPKRMDYWFSYDRNLISFNTEGFDISEVSSMANLFESCPKLSSVTLSTGWTNWKDDAYLPGGIWENGFLSKTETELYNEFPEHADEWAGTWTRSLAYAVLEDDGDLIFFRSNNQYPEREYAAATDTDGNTYQGVVFFIDESQYSYMLNFSTYSDQIINIKVAQGQTIRPQTMIQWFIGLRNLVSFESEGFDTSRATSFSYLFNNCPNLRNVDLSYFDTSAITDTSAMFYNCSSLVSIDLSDFDFSSVTYMSGMFNGCSSLESVSIRNSVTGNIVSLDRMFRGCSSLTSLNLNGIRTTEDTSMISMFEGCSNLQSVRFGSDFNWTSEAYLPEGNWKNNQKNITLTSVEMYNRSRDGELDLSGTWNRLDTPYVTPVGEEDQAYAVLTDEGDLIFFRSYEIYVGGNRRTVTDIYNNEYTGIVYAGIEKYAHPWGALNGGPWNSNRENIRRAYAAENQTIKPAAMYFWFFNCTNLESFDSTGFDTSEIDNMEFMFSGCSSLVSLDLSQFHTNEVTNMWRMFEDCSSLTILDLSSFDTTNVMDMSMMFEGCSSLENVIGIEDFDTSNLLDMYSMFEGCSSLTSLTLFNLKKSDYWSTMMHMFKDCTSLVYLDISGLDTSEMLERGGGDFEGLGTQCSGMSKIFDGCVNLLTVKLGPSWTAWYDDGILPEGVWKHGDLSKTETELQEEYPEHASEWAGVWTRSILAESLSFVDDEVYVAEGMTKELKIDILPEETVNKKLIWKSDNSDVATVDENGAVTGISKGTATITAATKDGSELFAECILTVVSPEEYSIMGNAYAVLTDEGDFVFFRSTENHENGEVSSVKDLNGKRYSGILYSGFEDIDDSWNVPAWNEISDQILKVYVAEDQTISPRSMFSWFSNCSNMLSFNGKGFNTSNVTNMSNMFNECSSLKTLNISGFDTSSVETMAQMFCNCSSLTSVDVRNFNTSNVGYMSGMFLGCSSLETLSLYNFNTFNLINMSSMFAGCESLKTLDLRYFDTTNLMYMDAAFANCSSLTSINIQNFNTSNVTSMSFLFQNCRSLRALNLSSFSTSNVTDMSRMFWGCESLGTVILRNFDTSHVISMEEMFYGCRNMIYLDLSTFDTSKVENMQSMFENCSSLKELMIDSFNTSNVVDMGQMFAGCSSLESLDVSGFVTFIVDDMHQMFAGCSSLALLDLSNFETSNVQSMYDMFNGCAALMQVKLGRYFINWFDNAFLPGGTWTKGNLGMSQIELYEEYPSHSFEWSGIWNRQPNIISIEIDDVTVFEGDAWTNWGEDNIPVYDYEPNLTVKTTKGTLTGGLWDIQSGFADLFGYQPHFENDIYNQQYNDGGWGIGSHNTYLLIDDTKGEYIANVVESCIRSITIEPVRIVQGDSNGRNIEDDGKIHLIYSETPNNISVTLTDGRTFDGEFNETIGKLEKAIKEKYGNVTVRYRFESDQNENEWDVGVHEAKIILCGKTSSYGIEIVENPIEEVSFEKLILFEGATETSYDYSFDETTGTWIRKEYEFYDVNPKEMTVRAFGEEYSGKINEVCEQLGDAFRLHGLTPKNIWPWNENNGGQSHDEVWGIGLHTAEIVFVGQTVPFDVEIIENPISDLRAENAFVEVENYFLNYDEHGNEYREYYDIQPSRISLILDGKRYSGETYAIRSLITEKYNTNIPIETISGQSSENEWGIGEHEAVFRFGGKEATYTVTVTSGEIRRVQPVSYSLPEDGIKTGTRVYLNCLTPFSKIWYSYNYSDEYMLYEDEIVLDSKYAEEGQLAINAYATADGYVDGEILSIYLHFDEESSDYGDILDADLNYYLENKEKCENLWMPPIEDMEYTGKAIVPEVTVYDGTKMLKPNTDYKVSCKNNIRAGTATLTITGKGNYVGTITRTFSIVGKQIVLNDIPDVVLVYNGKEQVVAAPKVSFGSTTLKNKTDYVYVIQDDAGNIFSKVKEKGTYHVLISPAVSGNYSFDEKVYDVRVIEPSLYKISSARLSGFVSKIEYSGESIWQNIVLTRNNEELVEGSDYVLHYYNNLNPGTATMVIEGIGDYYGTTVKTFTISKLPFSAETVTVSGLNSSYPFTEVVEPKVTLVYGEEKVLEQDVDYSVTYKNNNKAGTATMTFTGLGEYNGSFSLTYKITKLSLADMAVNELGTMLYQKGGVKPDVSIFNGENTLILGKDYTLSYKNNTKPGVATVTIKGKGNYEGTLTREFTIEKSYLSLTEMVVPDKVFTNKKGNFTTTVTLTDGNGKKLVAGTDYDKKIRYYYYYDTIVNGETRKKNSEVLSTDIVPVGTLLRIKVVGKGYYEYEKTGVFRIVSADISKATVTIPAQYYTGDAIYLNKNDIKIVLNKKKLDSQDYDIISYSNNIAKGTAKVTIQGKGIYGGTKTVSFKIVQRSMGVTVRFVAPSATSGTMKDQLVYKNSPLTKNTYKKVINGSTYQFLHWSLTPGGPKAYDNKETLIYDDYEPGTTVYLYAVFEGDEHIGLNTAYIAQHLGYSQYESGESGMETLRSEGYEVQTIEVGDDASGYKEQINDAINDGCNLILASSTFFEPIIELAHEYPEVRFVIYDDSRNPSELSSNMAIISYAQNEGSYLVGYMAAGLTETGQVAVNIGMDTPVMANYVIGYVNGVKDYNTQFGTDVKVVKGTVGSWSNPEAMKQICLDQQRNLNADVFYQVAGGSGMGLFEACYETGTWAIGVSSDQFATIQEGSNPEFADVIITSAVKDISSSLVTMVHMIDNGEDVWNKTNIFGVKENAVGYVENDFFKANVPQELRDALAQANADIKAGKLTVKSYYDFANEAEYDEYLASVQ